MYLTLFLVPMSTQEGAATAQAAAMHSARWHCAPCNAAKHQRVTTNGMLPGASSSYILLFASSRQALLALHGEEILWLKVV